MADTGWILVLSGADAALLGSVAWSNPGRVTADDGSDTTAVLTVAAVSHYIVGSNVGSPVPAGATIDGVIARVQWSQPPPVGAGIVDTSVSLWYDTGIVGDDKATATNLPGIPTNVDYGGAADTWNAGLTAAQVNSGLVGAAFSVTNNGLASSTASADAIWLKFYYTPVTPPIPRVLVANPTPDVDLPWDEL